MKIPQITWAIYTCCFIVSLWNLSWRTMLQESLWKILTEPNDLQIQRAWKIYPPTMTSHALDKQAPFLPSSISRNLSQYLNWIPPSSPRTLHRLHTSFNSASIQSTNSVARKSRNTISIATAALITFQRPLLSVENWLHEIVAVASEMQNGCHS